MRLLALFALVTLVSGAYEMALSDTGHPHMWVSILHAVAGSAALVMVAYIILFPRRRL